MPFDSTLIVGGVIAAFALFGAALAWADFQTRHLKYIKPPTQAREGREEMKKAA
jgi:hypothetical protein